MIQFIDLENGYSFDGLWTNNQANGYVFWFPNAQSTKLTYVMPICICNDSAESLTLSIEDNDIFSFISHNVNESVECAGFEFDVPVYSKTIISMPEAVNDKYLHIVYVSCKSNDAIEAVCRIDIENHGFIKVGADFYSEYEPAYINLSNFGVEIPDAVQKAIYDSNVHEDLKDNILINRKLKELMSNYWDVIANKGSYKSLLNSLDWFEWGDVLRLREIWKYANGNRIFYDDKEICSLLENKYIASLSNFVKTTYFSIYASLYKDTDKYDSEYNPILEDVVFKWGKTDLALKMSLLAEFFEAFFMPIHTSILHAAVEDAVYTNTIKTVLGSTICRTDSFIDTTYVHCNIKDDTVFRMTNVRAQVTNDTIYGMSDFKDNDYFGVDEFPNGEVDKSKIELFAAQYYTGPGIMIPIEFTIPNIFNNDFVKYTRIEFIDERYKDNPKIYEFNNIINSVDDKINWKFNLLIKEDSYYELNFMFVTAAGRTLNKKIKFSVVDPDNIHLQLYKVKSKNDSFGMTYNDWFDTSCMEYFYRIQSYDSTRFNKLADGTYDTSKWYYTQYMPYMGPDNPKYYNYNGVKLSRTIVFDVTNKNGKIKPELKGDALDYVRRWMSGDYLEFMKKDAEGNLTYLIYISKKFFADIPSMIKNRWSSYNIIRNDLGFYPQFHKLEKMEGDDINAYTISQYEAVCCGPEILSSSKNKSLPFKYGHLISDVEWSFINNTTGEVIEHTMSVRKPFIVGINNNSMRDGYYNVSFKYKLYDTVQNMQLDSAFRKKSI
jgi:hypothetical protein